MIGDDSTSLHVITCKSVLSFARRAGIARALRADQEKKGAASANCASRKCFSALRRLADDWFGKSSVSCALRRCAGAARRSARMKHQGPSAICASRRFIWRVAHLHGSSRALRRTAKKAHNQGTSSKIPVKIQAPSIMIPPSSPIAIPTSIMYC
ncbi:hypothetical protein A2U01_0031327 [Trifolium medium]|uniref:Uncharacterized protein n=1 Tax=Trifolium medium TaxID=97028 RepID=A0A392PH75_9FABA|nr:hypothetical protein [Trifolium medium]